MITDEQVAKIRHLFHAEQWKIGTIAPELHVRRDTVRVALETDRFRRLLANPRSSRDSPDDLPRSSAHFRFSSN